MAIYFTVYILLGIALLLTKKKQDKKCALVFLFVLLILGISRSLSVGADNLVYSMNFNATTENPGTWSKYTEFESGFNVLIVLFKNFISKDYYVFMGFLYIVWIIAYYRYLKIFKLGYLLPMFLGMSLCLFTTSYNIMRQFFALSLYSFVLPLLLKDRKIAYVIACVCIGFLFHRSVIALAIVGILLFDKFDFLFKNKKLLIIVIAFSFLLNFASDFLLSIFNRYIGFFELLGDRYAGYISHAEYEDEKGSKLGALLDTGMACMAVFSLNEKGRFYKLFIIFTGCSVLIQNILGPLFVIFLRVATNFAWMRSFVYASIILDKNKRYSKTINVVIYLYCIFIFTKAMVKGFDIIIPYVDRFNIL